LGHRVIGRPLRYHLFRHSSATYSATRLNRQELCYRYGWRFRSNMPDIYILADRLLQSANAQGDAFSHHQKHRACLAIARLCRRNSGSRNPYHGGMNDGETPHPLAVKARARPECSPLTSTQKRGFEPSFVFIGGPALA
jgi:hypothetical protein